MRFDKIIVLGNGKIADCCVYSLIKRGLKPLVFESQQNSLSMLGAVCNKNRLSFYNLPDKLSTMQKIKRVLDESDYSLLISANNEYIIPRELCEDDQLEIINFHYSYLPDYRGMNIPSWTIYNGETYTGISWHYINAKIDDGRIISQKKIPITNKTTALDIVRQGMNLGAKVFDSFIDDFLAHHIEGKNNRITNGHQYRKRDLPGDGTLDIKADGSYISKFLRAYDYGPIKMLPSPKVKINGDCYLINSFRIIKNGEILVGNSRWKTDYSLKKDDFRFELALGDV